MRIRRSTQCYGALHFAAGLLLPLLCLSAAACNNDVGLGAAQPQLTVKPFTEGQSYAAVDEAKPSIHLGEVPLYASKPALFLLKNPSGERLEIAKVEYAAPSEDTPPEAVAPMDTPILVFQDGTESAFPATLRGGQEAILRLTYLPNIAEEQAILATIYSNAGANPEQPVVVQGTGLFVGEPDIEIEFPGYVGPVAGQCADNGVCTVPEANALNFGNIGLGDSGTARLTLRNTSQCPAYPGAPPCSTCALTVQRNVDHYNVGLGFKTGTNDAGHFSFAGSTATPFEINQRTVSDTCADDGSVRLLLNFSAPMEEGEFKTVVVIESNDRDEPVIEIPIVAYARNAPVAVIKFRQLDVNNPSAPHSDGNNLQPLTRIHLDGSDSHTATGTITSYNWQIVEMPPGANPADFQLQQEGTFFSFWPPLAGTYVASLKVRNDAGIESGETDQSRLEMQVIPGSRLHVELTWNNSSNDQDLHLAKADVQGALCTSNDCYYANCTSRLGSTPVWTPGTPPREGPNPRLDIDDTNGFGPENINIDRPNAGTYRVYVHFFGGNQNATQNTVRIWLNGLQVAEFRRVLQRYDMWAVGDIVWADNSSNYVTPFPSDTEGQVGAIRNLTGVGCRNVNF